MNWEMIKKEVRHIREGLGKMKMFQSNENPSHIVKECYKDKTEFFKAMKESKTILDGVGDWKPLKLNKWGEVQKGIEIVG